MFMLQVATLINIAESLNTHRHMIVHSAVVICCYCVMMLMFLQGYHGLLSQAMTTERMYAKILTVGSLIHCAYIMYCYCTSLLVYRYLIFSLYHVYFYYLWPPCIADVNIFFALWFLLLLSIFFPCLFSAVADWMSTILPHMVWP